MIEGGHGLAAAGLADDAPGSSPCLDVEGDAVDGAQLTDLP